jgi:ketosteroid isomerase-like protein
MTTPNPIKLPATVAKYIDASNAGDAAAAAELFSESAIVQDDGAEHRGPAAIQEWVEESSRKYQAQLVPLALEESGGHAVLRGEVSGGFPGSPIELDFEFVLTHDKIARLVIK